MRTQKFISHCDCHKVEVIINIPDDCDETYDTVPDPVVDNYCQDIEMGERSGTFQDIPDDFFEEGYELSGSWRILEPDYELIYRIVKWWTTTIFLILIGIYSFNTLEKFPGMITTSNGLAVVKT